jgi:very-short-patch-repair endonuclease
LETLVAACTRFLEGLAGIDEQLDETRCCDLPDISRARAHQLRAFLAVDPQRVLADSAVPFRRLAHAHTLISRRDRLRAKLSETATGAEAALLGPEKLEAAHAALRWVRSVTASTVNDGLKQLLVSRRAEEIRAAVHETAKDWQQIEADRESTVVTLGEFGAERIAQSHPKELVHRLDDLLQRSRELPDFIPLRRQRDRIAAAGLADFLECADRIALEPHRLMETFRVLIADRRARNLRRTAELASNNGSALEARRRQFAERDHQKIQMDRAAIRTELLSRSPPVGSNSGPQSSWTEMRLLHNEFPKTQRYTRVRQLLGRAGRAIQTLKPCLMMSPLSLAKFAAPRGLEFELVVVDEASQMRPEDALGGMLRTKQIVVVGDPKQLPPTDFFSRADGQPSNGDADDAADDINAESILEVCQTTFNERRRLKWHYRSRCESLIAFSNRTFYDDSLVTFPTAKPGSFSIELVRVDGEYKGHRNPFEAQRVAEEAIAFMRHFADSPEEELPTLGVVTVNVEQRDQIFEDLRELSAGDELVERYREKADSKGEPFFVKNLENVQGDERDHIFISMTYGRKHGEAALAQHFGPINRRQGHRRLNVLFTRARRRIGLFTSFGSSDVRPGEGSSEGVSALKQYLEYVEARGRASVRQVGGAPDSDFETEVADRLRLRGYPVDLQVGVSDYRIDLGVRDPDNPERFLAGVECDGAAFHASKSARDRDRLREEMLVSLGWTILRVWSTDWFDNPELETDRLVRKLEHLRGPQPPGFHDYPTLQRVHETEVQTEQPGEPDGQATSMAESGLSAPSEPEAAAAPTLGAQANLYDGDEPLTTDDGARALEAFREEVIRLAVGNYEAHRSILRPAMIETFVQQRVVDPNDWYSRIPQYLRARTNPTEKKLYLEKICGIIDRIDRGSRG